MRFTLMGTVAAAILLAILFLSGGDDTWAGSHPLRVKDFDPGLVADVRLDQILAFTVRGPVRPRHLGFETFRITDVGGGHPRGTFVRGQPLFDPDSGTVVVIDPDEFSPAILRRVQRRGRLDLIPRSRRYDLGAVSVHDGNRMVLMDLHRKARRQVSFIPALPVLDDLSDTAFRPGEPYQVATGGKRGLREAFLAVAPTDPHLFMGPVTGGRPRIVHSDPAHDDGTIGSDWSIHLRFSCPLDPRTVGGQQSVFLHVLSLSGRPAIPVSTELRQTLLGTVELIVTPEQPLPPVQVLELSVTPALTNLLGHSIAPGTTLTFFNGGFSLPTDPVEETFTTRGQEDTAVTDADWNGAVAGALAAGDGTTTGQSLWYDAGFVSPNYGAPAVDLDAGGGTIVIHVQGSREDVHQAGAQPVDPDADPQRIHSTDWVELDQVDVLDNYQYLRFRVTFTGGDPRPVVRSLTIPVSTRRD